MNRRKNRLEKIVANPLVLLLAGALISGLLIPYITNQWQNYQKELELKTNLITMISVAVAKILVTAQLTNVHIANATEYYSAYSQWEMSSAEIGSYLRAYFPTYDIAERWDEYSNVTTSFFRLSARNQPAERHQLVEQIHQYLLKSNADVHNIHWQALENLNNTDFRSNWFAVNEQLLITKNNILQNILKQRILNPSFV